METKNVISRRLAITGMGAVLGHSFNKSLTGKRFEYKMKSIWKTHKKIPWQNTQDRLLRNSRSPGQALSVKWTQGQTMARKLQRNRKAKRKQSAYNRRQFGNGQSGGHCLCKGRRRCRHQLFSALIKAEGRKAVAIPGDLCEEAFCRSLVEQAQKALGGLGIIVNNAARQQTHASILDISTEDFDATMKTNIYAPFWIIKATLAYLKPGASIIGTSSVQAYAPTEDLYDYAQTKAATTNYIKSLAKQLAPKVIRVNGVTPGTIWTPLQVSGGATMEKLKEFGSQTPIWRPGQPAELASIYVQLAANDASYATGLIYGASGGEGNP